MYIQTSGPIATGEYYIRNKATGLALDANTKAYAQLSHGHPRVFMWNLNQQAPNHKWTLEQQPNGTYLIKTRYHGQDMALDGNTGVPQSGTHPAPFLYTATPHAPNHQWWLKPMNGAYLIVNAANGLALDGNTSGNNQHNHQHPSPFLYAETPHAPNHQWILEPAAPTYAPQLTPGKYLIVNKSTGQALDYNIRAAAQMSSGHPRVFTYAPTPHAPNHQWSIISTGGPSDEFFLTTEDGMALDGNTGVPNKAPSHPMPFLYQLTRSAANHKWKLTPVPYQPNTYFIVNAANGLALDGNVTGAPQHSPAHPSPFLWRKTDGAANHHWELRYAGPLTAPHTKTQPQPTIGGIIGGLIDASTQWINQQPVHPPQPIHPQQPMHPHHHPHHHHPHHHPHHHHPHQPHQPPQPFYPPQPQQPVYPGVAMNDQAFHGLLQSIKQAPFESDRNGVISTAANYNYFTCQQLAQIIGMLGFSSERENACRLIIPKLVDKYNSHVVLSCLTFSSEKDKVRHMFQ